MKDLLLKLRSTRYRKVNDILVLITIALPMLIVFGGKALLPDKGELAIRTTQCGGTLLLFLMGCVGLIAMIRREFRQVVMIRGRSAQIMGAVMWLSSWAVLIYSLVWIFFLDQ